MNDFHSVADYMPSFFYQYLTNARGLSSNTIFAYRDSIKLLLCFTADRLKKKVDQLKIEDLDEKTILAFLNDLENERGNSVKTRNSRLAAIRSFFSFVGREAPTLLKQCHKIRTIATKRVEHKQMEYLENDEVQAIFDAIDLLSRTGLRDKALLLTLYNTGARVQEIIDLSPNALRLDLPGQVKILGKGRKRRTCPLWPETVEAIKFYLKERCEENANDPLFLNANGNPITRFGVRHIIREYAQKAAQRCPSLKCKNIGPHTWRHTTAMHLLRAGNDLNMVRIWLGHADLNTTHAYIEIDMDMKRKILGTNSAPVMQNSTKKWHRPDILEWLDSLSKDIPK